MIGRGEEENEIESYWNHNTAFHDELVADAKLRGGRVLEYAPFCILWNTPLVLLQNALILSTVSNRMLIPLHPSSIVNMILRRRL